MRRLLLVVMLLAIAGTAMAANLSNRFDPKPAGTVYEGGTRQGGDIIASATPIGGLPYYDSGLTTGYVNDYDEICPYTGSTSPDVVYSYVPSTNQALTIDLCSSSYDTKVYVYQNAQGNLIACNDDAGCGYSGWQSKLVGVSVVAGNTYYIVVDGYGGANGTYVLSVDAPPPCTVTCPAGALIEGEPPCYDNMTDTFDGGCNGAGWIDVAATSGGCADVCGTSCTFLYNGLAYRDTDWYRVFGVGGTLTYTCRAEFPLQTIIIYGLNCASPSYVVGTGDPCTDVTLTWNAAAGQEIWLWVGAQGGANIPDPVDYAFHACGIGGPPTPVQNTSWGAIKHTYR